MIPDVAERTADLSEICELYHVARLDIYGKAVTAEQRTDEVELNFLVDFRPEISQDTYTDSYFGLLESLEELFGAACQIDDRLCVGDKPVCKAN